MLRPSNVYQRSIKELSERNSLLWLVFTPLAIDADAKLLRQVVKSIESKALDERTFVEIAGATTAIADVDKCGRNLRSGETVAPEILMLSYLPREVVMQSWIYKEGKREGEREGEKQGLKLGLKQGLLEAIADICSLLNIPVGAKESAVLTSLDVEGLERLRQALKTERRWPESFRTSAA